MLPCTIFASASTRPPSFVVGRVIPLPCCARKKKVYKISLQVFAGFHRVLDAGFGESGGGMPGRRCEDKVWLGGGAASTLLIC